MARAERGHGAGAHLRDPRRVDDRSRLPGPGVHEHQQRKLGRQTDAVVVTKVADHLHAGEPEGQHDPAEHVEVSVDPGIGLEVHARLEHGPSLALRAQRRLDRVEDLVVGQRQALDVGTVQVRELKRRHPARR